MKPFAISAVLVTLSFFASGQSYHPMLNAGFRWDVFYSDPTYLCNIYSGKHFFIENDTVIQGKDYQFLKNNFIYCNYGGYVYCPPFFVDTTYKGTYAYLREDTIAQKIFYYDTTAIAERTLYDFTLQVNDTFPGLTFGIPQVITLIDTIILPNGSVRRRFNLDNGGLFYVEGIGAESGPFEPMFYSVTPGLGSGLYCFSENGNTLYPPNTGYYCAGFVGIKENKLREEITVKVNEALNEITVDYELPEPATFRIIATDGKTIFTKTIHKGIDVIPLPRNLYGINYYLIENSNMHYSGNFTKF